MKMQMFFLRAKFLLIPLAICYNSKNYDKLLVIVSWFSCHLDMICVPHPSTIKPCVSMTVSQKKKMLQNIFIWYFLLFLWCKNLPQKKTFIATMHSSWWIIISPLGNYFNAKMNVSKKVQIECFKMYE
jgi:hypothetical protein